MRVFHPLVGWKGGVEGADRVGAELHWEPADPPPKSEELAETKLALLLESLLSRPATDSFRV